MVCVFKHLHCSAQLSMSSMEKRYRNKIIIIIIIPYQVFVHCLKETNVGLRVGLSAFSVEQCVSDDYADSVHCTASLAYLLRRPPRER